MFYTNTCSLSSPNFFEDVGPVLVLESVENPRFLEPLPRFLRVLHGVELEEDETRTSAPSREDAAT
jgi:hypothetical protein